jgi:hypothetical protein
MSGEQGRIIAIGGSAGGIAAIKTMCGALTPDIPAAICIVIHVGARGHNLLADIFQQRCPIPMETAVDGQKLQHGRAYVAAADHHLIVEEDVIRLGRGPRENLARPAIDPLLRSAGLSYGSRAIGVVLTGMLNDGASGLADLKRCGGVTIVQNPIEALEREMPLSALAASDVDYQAPIAELGALFKLLLAEPRAVSAAAGGCPSGGRDRARTANRNRRDESACASRRAVLSCLRRRNVANEERAAAQISLPGRTRLHGGNAVLGAGGFRRRSDARRSADRGGAGGPHAENGGRGAPRRIAPFRLLL